MDALEHQVTGGLFRYSILVADNDINRSAEPVVLSFAKKSVIDIEYYVERIQNIALARNMAVRNAKGDLIAFIDDDEIPEMNWLFSLYHALHHYNADGVLGPVIPNYQVAPPKWVIKGKFYERPTYETGFVIDWTKGRTGNLLIKKEMFSATVDLFDPSFGSGGEDQDFTRRMIQKGHIFIWCNEALAHESVPPIRWKRVFMIKRALLRGKMSLRYPTSRLIMFIRASLAIPVYVMALPLLALFGHHLFMQYVIKTFDHCGRIFAMIKVDVINQKYITR